MLIRQKRIGNEVTVFAEMDTVTVKIFNHSEYYEN